MDSDSDVSRTESVCSSNCTVESAASDGNPCASQLSQDESRQFPWSTAIIPIVEDADFGSLVNIYSPPLIICFYRDVCGNPVTRIGEFCDVPLGEAVRALNVQHEHTRYTNLFIRFDSCREEDVSNFLPVLRLLLFRCQINFAKTEWERCVLHMTDYKFASRIVEVIAEFTSKIYELNIGSLQHLREQRHRTNPEAEAKHILGMLEIWLPRCFRFLRCLRLFAFVKMDARLSQLLSGCPFLSHISLCRVSGIECPVLNGIESFEFNGYGMAYTELDLHVAKNMVKYFPNLKIIAFREVCFEPVMTSLIRHLASTGRRFELYQNISLQQFTSLVKSMFTARPNRGDDCIELLNERYGTRLIVYDSRQVYHTPFQKA
ncbi:hypothetical protein KIN20_033858 [Parelaphostrongylus tenuis]|uniref:Uncharacterized protein n=1 Tax=Parelaphostrongylus tenuis TaxID=148309 RepID=A0AAD5R941_PARTN|nr:hypothetical protein KIN20_033858 [Parelaphostrongylus tenuis]